jgi:hypothetical protein
MGPLEGGGEQPHRAERGAGTARAEELDRAAAGGEGKDRSREERERREPVRKSHRCP